MTTSTVARARSAGPLQSAFPVVAVGAAGIVGAAVAVDPRLGLGLVLTLVMVPLALFNLSLAIAGWAALGSLSSLPALGMAATAAGLLVLGGWFVVACTDPPRLREGFAGQSLVVVSIALLLTWMTLSIVWAEDTTAAAAELGRWFTGAAVVLVVVTALRGERDARLVIGGLVAGVVLSVLVGLVSGGAGGPPTEVDTLTSTEGRLQGGRGDPNVLAAITIPATVLAAGLLPGRGVLGRVTLLTAIGVLVVGLGATQSRGGAIGAIVTLVAAFALMPGRRMRVAGVAVGVLLLGVLYFSAYPGALDRLTSTADRGNGRSELWRVAAQVSADHPVVGVGLDNFTTYSPRYVREPGPMEFVALVAERPHVAHNTYLQVLAETGVVGLALFLLVLAASLRATWRASVRFRQAGDAGMETLARAVLVATIGLLAAAAFITAGSDPMLWLLLALGPGLLAVSRRATDGSASVALAPSPAELPDSGSPHRLKPLIDRRILAAAVEHPALGPRRIAAALAGSGLPAVAVSPQRVYRTLKRHRLNTRARRMAALSTSVPRGAGHPGAAVAMGSLFITPPQGAGHGSWQISAIDLHSGYAWADLVTAPAGGPLPEQLAGLAARVAEELREAGWRLEHVVTDGRRELEVPTFTRSVRALGARCRRGVSGSRDTLTAIETFHRATVKQFWGPLLSDAPSGGEADLRRRLDEYVAGYNRRNAAPTG